MKLLSKIRGLYRFDGDDAPILVSRRKFVFVGGVVAAALAVPAGVSVFAPAGPEIDLTTFLRRMQGERSGAVHRWNGIRWVCDGDVFLPNGSNVDWTVAGKLDPRNPSQWSSVVPSVPRDVERRIEAGIREHSWTPEAWADLAARLRPTA